MLLVLLDGDCQDMKNTRALIAELSFLPVSVLFVGVGHGPFSAMYGLNERVPGAKRDMC